MPKRYDAMQRVGDGGGELDDIKIPRTGFFVRCGGRFFFFLRKADLLYALFFSPPPVSFGEEKK